VSGKYGRPLAVLVVCAACGSHASLSSFPHEVPPGGRYIVLQKHLPQTGRVSTLVRIRERPGHRADGELSVMHWHRPERTAGWTGAGEEALDSVERREREALEATYGCREWGGLSEYHGNWGWVCLAPFPAGQPNWARLARRIDDFRARRAEKRAVWPAGVPLDTINPVVWDITVWTARGADSHWSLLTRPVDGVLDSAAALYNAEGGALIDSIVALARRR
jgi:hypothetical protein